jgi:hypothetical protein
MPHNRYSLQKFLGVYMKVSHRTLLVLSGIIWLAIGVMLLRLGIVFIMEGSFMNQGQESFAVLIIALGLIVGNLKGKFVMRKAAVKSFKRITALPNPTSVTNIYNRANYILVFLMMGIGMSMKYLGLMPDVRGFIDIAVGAALIQGGIHYFNLSATCGSVNPS